MGIPTIKLNLAPPPTLWRLHHSIIAWIVFAIGTVGLSISIIATLKAYREADIAGQRTVAITEQARTAQRQQTLIMNELREIKVEQEMPRWRLAERILMERALPWSRITAELERSLVQDVRIKSIQRTRGNDQTVQLKLRGESRNTDAETDFIESLKENFAFAQVILEKESELTNSRGAIEFDYSLLLNTEPPEYELLPKYGPEPNSTRRSARGSATAESSPVTQAQPQENVSPPTTQTPPATTTGTTQQQRSAQRRTIPGSGASR
ncbi:MAG: hypothetical protein FWG02_01220 [Holophagaceae bacterium]|nr:hypothetical protein [Holophagaceae bacterium]